jgi:hypothetical protein
MQQPPQPPLPLRLEIPGSLTPVYANAAIVSHTHSEIVLDFVQTLPNDPRARLQARVVMTPANAKLFLKALTENLSIFEQKNGEISLPQTPPSLADQLFSGGAKPEDGGPKNE